MTMKEIYTGFWWGSQKENGHLHVDERIILKWALER
jgi:hypothetical protein